MPTPGTHCIRTKVSHHIGICLTETFTQAMSLWQGVSLTQNSNHLRFVIVLDRAGYITPHVTGNNVTVVYTASDKADIPEGVAADRVITYEADTLNIPHVPDFNSLSLEKKIQKYSSMPIIQKMINILEGDV